MAAAAFHPILPAFSLRTGRSPRPSEPRRTNTDLQAPRSSKIVGDAGEDPIGRVTIPDSTDPDPDSGLPLPGLVESNRDGIPIGPQTVDVVPQTVLHPLCHLDLQLPQSSQGCRPDPIDACKKEPAVLRPPLECPVGHQSRGNAPGEQRRQGRYREQARGSHVSHHVFLTLAKTRVLSGNRQPHVSAKPRHSGIARQHTFARSPSSIWGPRPRAGHTALPSPARDQPEPDSFIRRLYLSGATSPACSSASVLEAAATPSWNRRALRRQRVSSVGPPFPREGTRRGRQGRYPRHGSQAAVYPAY